MWPWGHLAVGYVAFSLFVRVGLGRRPSGRAAILLSIATQLPDLVDKPLAWQFGLLSDGTGAAHSLLVGVPVALALGVWLRIRERPELSGALAIGYGSHVLGDLLFATLFSRPPVLQSFLWPLYRPTTPAKPGFVPKVWEHLLNSRALLEGSMGRTFFLLEAGLLLATLVLWVADGAPGLGAVRAVVDRRR